MVCLILARIFLNINNNGIPDIQRRRKNIRNVRDARAGYVTSPPPMGLSTQGGLPFRKISGIFGSS